MPVAKKELYERGVALAVALCKHNRWRVPKFRNRYLNSTGLYTPNTVSVYVEATAWLVNNPTVRRQSHPGWKTDRTAMGVVLHELGHHIWFMCSNGKSHHEFRKVWRSERVSGYEPCVEEAFAETFRLWALNPSLLKAACPQRYKVLVKAFGVRHTGAKHWRRVLPATFHPRALQWAQRGA